MFDWCNLDKVSVKGISLYVRGIPGEILNLVKMGVSGLWTWEISFIWPSQKWRIRETVDTGSLGILVKACSLLSVSLLIEWIAEKRVRLVISCYAHYHGFTLCYVRLMACTDDNVWVNEKCLCLLSPNNKVISSLPSYGMILFSF